MVGIKVLIDHVLFVGNRSKRRYEYILPNKFAFVVIAVDSHEVSSPPINLLRIFLVHH